MCYSESMNIYNRATKLMPMTFVLLLQMSTSVIKEHTAVMLMLCVTTPGDPITARAKMDFMVMEKAALVTICKTV